MTVGATVVAAVASPLLQLYDAPPAAVSVVEVVVQFSTLTPVMLAIGGVVFTVTACVAVAVQPFAPVTVTV